MRSCMGHACVGTSLGQRQGNTPINLHSTHILPAHSCIVVPCLLIHSIQTRYAQSMHKAPLLALKTMLHNQAHGQTPNRNLFQLALYI